VNTPMPPMPRGFIAEAVATQYVSPVHTWKGGRNAGWDILEGDCKIDVKSGDIAEKKFTPDGEPEPAIGVKLSGGLEKLKAKDTDELLIVVLGKQVEVKTLYIGADEHSASARFEIIAPGAVTYRVPVSRVVDVFKQPYLPNGAQHKSIENLWAPLRELQASRPIPRTRTDLTAR
jgi:hypothetical protein